MVIYRLYKVGRCVDCGNCEAYLPAELRLGQRRERIFGAWEYRRWEVEIEKALIKCHLKILRKEGPV